MPEGEDEIRKRYFSIGRTHPNRRSKKKSGFEGNNWPSTRTFYSDVPLHVVGLSKEFQFYVDLVGMRFIGNSASEVPVFLEQVSKRETKCYISNYTISGMLNSKWGVRHKPKPRTQEAIHKLIDWLKNLARQMGVYKPFNFQYDKLDLVKPNQTTNEKRQNSSKEKERKYKPTVSQDAPLYRRRLDG